MNTKCISSKTGPHYKQGGILNRGSYDHLKVQYLERAFYSKDFAPQNRRPSSADLFQLHFIVSHWSWSESTTLSLQNAVLEPSLSMIRLQKPPCYKIEGSNTKIPYKIAWLAVLWTQVPRFCSGNCNLNPFLGKPICNPNTAVFKKKRPWIPIFRELPPEIFSPPGRWKIAPCGTSAVSRTCQGWWNKLGEGEMIRPPSATVVRLGFQWIATLAVLVVIVYRTCHDLGAVACGRWDQPLILHTETLIFFT